MSAALITAIAFIGVAVLAVLALAIWPVETGLSPIAPNQGPGSRGGIVTGLLSGIV